MPLAPRTGFADMRLILTREGFAVAHYNQKNEYESIKYL